jgi:hypothetical protein
VEVLHGSGGGDSEDTDEVDGIFSLAGLVQDSVGANSAQSQTGGIEASMAGSRPNDLGASGPSSLRVSGRSAIWRPWSGGA